MKNRRGFNLPGQSVRPARSCADVSRRRWTIYRPLGVSLVF